MVDVVEIIFDVIFYNLFGRSFFCKDIKILFFCIFSVFFFMEIVGIIVCSCF